MLQKHEDFYVDEIRVGLERSDEKRTAKDGYLYNIIHVRPKREAALAVYVSGIPPAWRVKDQLAVPLGGEGRLAAVQVMSGNPSEILPPAPFLVAGRDGKVRFTVILVTPGWYGEGESLQKVIRQSIPNTRTLPGSLYR